VPEAGLFVPFFGQAAFTDRLVHRLALKSGATPLLVALIRNPRGRFDVHYQTVPDLGQEDEVLALTALNVAVEYLVRQYPTQYQWEYKRFKKQPTGMQDPYKPL
jgi:KDO2-lipid IV(A) lauroyltransferase